MLSLQFIVMTDASLWGWSVSIEDSVSHHSLQFGDPSSKTQLSEHINILVSLAVQDTLLESQVLLSNHSILLLSDKVSTLSYLRHQGGHQVQEFH